MWVSVILAAAAIALALFVVGLPRAERVRLDVLVWPPRITPLAFHPTAAIAHGYSRREIRGVVRFPRVAYLNDSKFISAKLSMMWLPASRDEIERLRTRVAEGTGEYPVYIESNEPDLINDTGSMITQALVDGLRTSLTPTHSMIEAELLAAGITIPEGRVQRKHTSQSMEWDFPALFDKSGVHEVAVVFRLVKLQPDSQSAVDLYRTPTHIIRVVTIAGLTQRQVVWLSGASAAASLAWVIIQTLRGLALI